MKLEYIKKEGTKEIILLTNTNNEEVKNKLLYELYSVTINKRKHKSVNSRSYANEQTVNFIDKLTGTTYITRISGIPTSWGILDIDRI